MQRLQMVQWNFFHYRIPAYYLVVLIPILVVLSGVFLIGRLRGGVWSWAWWLFPIACLPGIVWGVDSAWGLRQWLSLWSRGLAVGASLAWLLETPESSWKILRWAYGAAIVACLFGLTELALQANPLMDNFVSKTPSEILPADGGPNPLYQRPTDFSGSGRPMGTQGNRIPFTACLVPFLPIALWKAAMPRKMAWVHFFAAAALMSLILLSNARSGWVAVIVGVTAYLLLSTGEARRKAGWVLAGAVFLVALWLSWPSNLARVVSRAHSFTLKNQDVQHRLGSLPTVGAMKGRWLFGVGVGNYPKVYAPYYRGPFKYLSTPDNQYLRWLIETGIAGFGVLMLFLGGLAHACWRRMTSAAFQGDRPFYAAVLAGWISIATTFLFFDGFYWIGPNMTFWGFLGLLTATLRNNDEKLRL